MVGLYSSIVWFKQGEASALKRLYRSNQDRMVAGVLAGIGEYLNIDPTIIRLLFVVLLFISFFTVGLLYLVAAIIIPNEGEVR